LTTVLVLQHSRVGLIGALEEPLRAAGFEMETWRTFADPAPPRHVGQVDALIGLGGTMHPDEDAAHAWLPEVRAMYRQAIARDIPVLGVCLGAQLIAQALGGGAGPIGRLRVGFLPVEVRAGDDPLFGDLPETIRPLSWHEYAIDAPPGAQVLAAADGTPQVVRFAPRAWGVQFHAELAGHVDHWFSSGGDALRERGVDVGAITADLDAAVAEWQPHAMAIAARFAAIAMARD
jgi:GMP synthase (glutamine-hydrolysing)